MSNEGLTPYKITWIKKTVDELVSGTKTYFLDDDMLKVRIPINEEPLVSSELVLTLAGKGLLMVWAGVMSEDRNTFEIAISEFDEWVDYD